MAYFAIISDNSSSLKVVRCHINVWALDEAFGMTFFFDVGLGLNANGSDPITKFSLALPFRHTEFVDLKGKLMDANTARLILGQPVQINKDGVISFVDSSPDGKTKPIKLKTTHVPEPERDDKMSTENYSLLNFELKSAIEQLGTSSPETYLRMRFSVKSFSRTWVRQDSGALVDIRISDVREGLAAQWNALEEKIVPIDSLNLFIIAPSTMKKRSVSPELKYARLLEGPLWETYLDRKLQLVGRKKHVIYYWRNDKPISHNKPFMAFLDLAKEQTPGYWWFVFLTALILATAWGFYRFLPSTYAAKDAWAYIVSVVGGLVSLGFIKKAWAGRTLVVEIVTKFVTLPRRLNSWFYSTQNSAHK